MPSKQKTESRENEVLRRLLATPPKAHKDEKHPRPKPKLKSATPKAKGKQ